MTARFLLTAAVCAGLAAQEEAVRSARYVQWIAMAEAMMGARTQQPELVPLDPHPSLVGRWELRAHERVLRFELRADGAVVGDGNARIWSVDGDCVFLDEDAASPMALLVKTVAGYRLFSADTWDWPVLNRLPAADVSAATP